MATIKFYRGPESGYAYNGSSVITHKDGLYFANDTQKIWLNGVAYGGGDLSNELLRVVASVDFRYDADSGKNQLILKNSEGTQLGNAVNLDLVLPEHYHEFSSLSSAQSAPGLSLGHHVLVSGDSGEGNNGLYLVKSVRAESSASGTVYTNILLELATGNDIDELRDSVAMSASSIAALTGRVDAHDTDIAEIRAQLAGLSGAMHFVGVSSTDPKENVTVEGIGTFSKGDVVLYQSKEYVYTGTKWEEFGDTNEVAGKLTELEGRFEQSKTKLDNLYDEVGDPGEVNNAGVVTKEATGIYKVINQSIDGAMMWNEIEE